MFVVTILIIFGLIFSYLIGYRFGRKSLIVVGTLHVETSDPDGIYLFAELACPINYVMGLEFIVMKVDTMSYLAQK